MKRKPQPGEERRRPLAEINLADDGRRIPMARKGCARRIAGLLGLSLTAAAVVGAAVTAGR